MNQIFEVILFTDNTNTPIQSIHMWAMAQFVYAFCIPCPLLLREGTIHQTSSVSEYIHVWLWLWRPISLFVFSFEWDSSVCVYPCLYMLYEPIHYFPTSSLVLWLGVCHLLRPVCKRLSSGIFIDLHTVKLHQCCIRNQFNGMEVFFLGTFHKILELSVILFVAFLQSVYLTHVRQWIAMEGPPPPPPSKISFLSNIVINHSPLALFYNVVGAVYGGLLDSLVTALKVCSSQIQSSVFFLLTGNQYIH